MTRLLRVQDPPDYQQLVTVWYGFFKKKIIMTIGQNMEAQTNFEGHSPLEWGNFSCLPSLKIPCHLMAEQTREQCLCLTCGLLKELQDASKKKVNGNLFWVQKRKILGENQGASSLSCYITSCLCKHTKRWDPPSVVAVLLL